MGTTKGAQTDRTCGDPRGSRRDRYARAFIAARIASVFERLDTDRDGFLGLNDLKAAVRTYAGSKHADMVQEIMFEVDDHSNGKLSKSDVCNLMARLQRTRFRASGTGTNILRALIEFLMFDVHDRGTLDKYDMQQLLYVYFGYQDRALDQKTDELLKAAQNPSIDFSTYLASMDKFQMVCRLPEDAFVPLPPNYSQKRKVSLQAAAASARNSANLQREMAKETRKTKFCRQKAKPMPPWMSSKDQRGSVGIDDRTDHRRQIRERQFKRMSAIIQGELKQEKAEYDSKKEENKRERLPPLVGVSKRERALNPIIHETAKEPPKPQPPASKPKDGYKARRASVNECGEIFLITDETASNVLKRPQFASALLGKTQLQREIDAQIAKCKLSLTSSSDFKHNSGAATARR